MGVNIAFQLSTTRTFPINIHWPSPLSLLNHHHHHHHHHITLSIWQVSSKILDWTGDLKEQDTICRNELLFLWQSHEHAASVLYFCVWLFQFDNLKVFGRGWYMVGYEWQIELIETGDRVKTNLQFVVELFSASTFGAI